jgi:putative flippase GtrA
MLKLSARELLSRVLHSEKPMYQLARHLAVGGTGVCFNWLAFSALRHFTTLGTLGSTLIVHALMLVSIFPLQKLFTFKKREHGRVQAVRFLINDAGYLTLDYSFAYFFIDFMDLPTLVGKACGLALLTPLSFMSQRFWVFRR